MMMKRVVSIIDTNIVVAGLITGDVCSPPARILDVMLTSEFLYLMSADLLSEYASVLRRPKLTRLHGFSDDEIDVLLSELVVNAVWREPPAPEKAPDRGDDHLWALLSAETGSLLVTGDQLLIENPPGRKSVISARQFVDMHLPLAGS